MDNEEYLAKSRECRMDIEAAAATRMTPWTYRDLPPHLQILISPVCLKDNIETYIQSLVFQFAGSIAGKRPSIAGGYKAGHSPGVIDYLNEEFPLADLKQPAWWKDSDDGRHLLYSSSNPPGCDRDN